MIARLLLYQPAFWLLAAVAQARSFEPPQTLHPSWVFLLAAHASDRPSSELRQSQDFPRRMTILAMPLHYRLLPHKATDTAERRLWQDRMWQFALAQFVVRIMCSCTVYCSFSCD